MRKLEIKEFREVQMGILSAVAAFCDANGISYWIDSGTLLGAIRHKGYIPWDDDIDIGMLRPDYEKFSALFNASNSRYRFCSYELDRNFLYPFGKVLDTRTVLYEPDENGNKLCVNIDIFIYDNAPDDDRQVAWMYKVRDFHRTMHFVRNGLISSKGSKARSAVLKAGELALKPFPRDFFVRQMVKNCKRYAGEQTARVGNFTAVSRIACEKDVFDSFETAEFESRMYRIPGGYDRWLRAFYGEYMVLPPKEKQVAHHAFVAYILDGEQVQNAGENNV